MQRLTHHPEPQVSSIRDLVGIAYAIEQEAIRRYWLLAREMDARGQAETAEMLRRLALEEEKHASRVEGWAERVSGRAPESRSFSWRLPPEIASSWDEVRTSALLTPYRALAVAVANEERAFAFYSYVAAEAPDSRVAEEAERLARGKLEHAALLRQWRRAAYRQGGRAAEQTRPVVRDPAALGALINQAEAEIAACHREISGRLEAAGDTQGAALLGGPRVEMRGAAPPGAECSNPECRDNRPAVLLVAAQRPLERFSEMLEGVLLEGADEETVLLAQQHLEGVVARIARIARHLEQWVAAEHHWNAGRSGPAGIREGAGNGSTR